MPATEWGFEVTPEELAAWTIFRDDDLFVVDKPGGLVCHPSKRGPWSSLVGAAREYLGADVLHMPSRLDRETSGVVVFARGRETARKLQTAIERRRVSKVYWAVLEGRLESPVTVEQPIGPAEGAIVVARQAVRPDGRESITSFEPEAWAGGRTLVRVRPLTGRMHQIRVHAAWLGHPVAGDKIYGPDERWYLEFVRNGFTKEMERALGISRHALHCAEIGFPDNLSFQARWPDFLSEWSGLRPSPPEPPPRP